MRRQLLPALRAMLVFTLLLGAVYPLVVTGLGQVAFSGAANGSLVEADGVPVGSALLGQGFTGDEYFESRPSAAGDGYDPTSTSASNLGPTNPELLAGVEERVAAYRERHGLADDATVPVDAVAASGSGLDPHISVANARVQVPGVAAARGVEEEAVRTLVDAATEGRTLGVFGEPGVNVLLLNLALDGEG